MKNFHPSMITPAMKKATEMVLLAKASVETIAPIVIKHQTEVLAKHQFLLAKEWVTETDPSHAITDPKESYLMEDEDFEIYHVEVKALNEKAGLKVDDPSHCPKLVAEHLLSQAEHVLIDALEPLTGATSDQICSDLEIYKKYIDLSLSFLVRFIDETSGKELIKKYSTK